MTRTVKAFGLSEMIVMVLGTWFHRPALIIAGLILTVIAWNSGGAARRQMKDTDRPDRGLVLLCWQEGLR